MNWKLICGVVLVGSHVAVSALEIAANRRLRKVAQQRAVEMRPASETEALKLAKDELKAYDKLKREEERVMNVRVDTWKREARYDDRKRDIYRNLEDGVNRFKESIDYDMQKQAATDLCENELKAFKESIDYDTKIGDLERTISEARSKYDADIRLCESYSGSSNSDVAATLKLDAEKAKNKAVNEAEAEIKKIKAEVEAKQKVLEKTKQNEIQKLESQVLNERTRLKKGSDAELDALEKELKAAKDDISRDIAASRTDADREAIRRHSANKETVKDQEFTDAKRAADIREETPRHEKLADWLKSKEVPKWLVVGLAAVPLIAVGYLCGQYVILVANVVKAM